MLNLKTISKILGALLGIEALLMSLCLFVSLWYKDNDIVAFLWAILITVVAGAVFRLMGRHANNTIGRRDAYFVVAVAWVIFSLFGTLPFLISGDIPNFTNAFFETMSGFTTTGATIVDYPEHLPKGLLFWRSLTQWIGGLGIVFFTIAILPSLVGGSLKVFAAESTGPIKSKLHPRLSTGAKWIWIVYLVLTVACILSYKVCGMNWFDALCHAMSACATSGFSTKNASIAYFNSPAIDTILIFAMATAGVHFGLIYATVTGKRSNIFRSEVTRWYFGMLLAGGVLIAVSLFAADIYPTLTASFRYAMFQFVSVVTTTGFATADSNTWTSFAVILLIFGSIVCACAGSTAGGIKVNRLVLAGKMMRTRLRQQQHPNAIIRIRLDSVIQENEALHAVMIFIVTYLMFILAGTVFGTMLGVDLTTSFTGAVASMGNVGPGFGEVGSMDNFSAMPAAFKVSNSLLMLLGRLEIFGLIQIFFIKWWR